jgi:saccharopine dehydrogenase-like NADP-dependent oxidoreductase
MPLLLAVLFSSGLKLPCLSTRGRPTRVAVLGGGFAGLTAARTLVSNRQVEVLLVDQRKYFEYTVRRPPRLEAVAVYASRS